jgi:hypothetical protein
MPEKVSSDSAGCWIDGHWGWRADGQLLAIAQSYGFPLGKLEANLVDAWLQGDTNVDADEIHWLADEARNWMNENIAPDGYYFDWFDCEFFLWSDNDWQEVA